MNISSNNVIEQVNLTNVSCFIVRVKPWTNCFKYWKIDEWMNNVLWKRTIKIADKSQTIN
jgi:hypothetical protein